MLYYLFMLVLAAATIYNLSKYVELEIKAKLSFDNYVSMTAVIAILAVLIRQWGFIFQNIMLAILLILYSISGILVKGFNRKGITTTSAFTFLAKYIKWTDVIDMTLEFPVEDAVDLTVMTNTKAFTHRYDEKYEKTILTIKKDLKM